MRDSKKAATTSARTMFSRPARANCATATATHRRPARRAQPGPQHDHALDTVYLDHAIEQLRADGYPVLDPDVARLSPYMRRRMNFHGRHCYASTNLGGSRLARPVTVLESALVRDKRALSLRRAPRRVSRLAPHGRDHGTGTRDWRLDRNRSS
jgi:hypothetical protein